MLPPNEDRDNRSRLVVLNESGSRFAWLWNVGALLAFAVFVGWVNRAPAPTSTTGQSPQQETPPAGSAWYAVGIDLRECVETVSPAERIADLRQQGLSPRTYDRKDLNGSLAVEVSYPISDFSKSVTTYYRSRNGCEAELAQSNAIPDRYR